MLPTMCQPCMVRLAHTSLQAIRGVEKREAKALASKGLEALQPPHWDPRQVPSSITGDMAAALGGLLESAVLSLCEQLSSGKQGAKQVTKDLLLQYLDKLGDIVKQRTVMRR